MITAREARRDGTPVRVEETILFLSEPYDPDRIGGRFDQIAARFEDLLELRSRAAARGYHDLHELYTERIIDEVLSDAFGLSGPDGHAA